ncbi:MAG: hypothetical protein UT29_C0001G0127 [Candidatus Yanofskybacteria bacterium GW2011_GWA1_39_13]|uniref:Uncharacterized protein n=1 Tax=Yanofskybacteria sp. (strain GW2011_GWA1_39_13) TaxID=1619019 RepID=A0A0G0QLV3_YANXG|nr:MAG: hypothetical protein UT29_C0001G0127 [Candidatus Yanofskybacteria bacterium GW2011_GWA1_39_13]
MFSPQSVQRCQLRRGMIVIDLRRCFRNPYLNEQHQSLGRIIKKGIRSGSSVVKVGDKVAAVFMVAGNGFSFSDYQPYLQYIVDGGSKTSKKTFFADAVKIQLGIKTNRKNQLKINLWFDFKNDVLWTLTRDNLEVLVSALMSLKSRISQEQKS